MKRVDLIFGMGFIGSIAVGVVLWIFIHPLLALLISVVGCAMSGIYRSRTRRIKMKDERSHFIDGKAAILTVAITFPVFGGAFLVISVFSIDILAQAVLGPLFAFYGVTFSISYYYYDRRYR